MNLRELLNGISVDPYTPRPDLEISGLAYDSRQLQSTQLFVAIEGTKSDGHLYLDRAIERGAAVVMSEKEKPLGFPLPWIKVPQVRKAMAQAAANFYGSPSHTLQLLGVTGTNGKTSIAYMVEAVLKEAGERVGVLSTIEYRGPGGSRPATHTTPESLDLQRMLSGFVAEQCAYAVMEVSSHALALDRIHACRFRSAVFTNLTPDHLDYHRTLEEYFTAKKQLFTGCGEGVPRQSILNLDDPRGLELRELCAGRCQTFALDWDADYRLIAEHTTGPRVRLEYQTPSGILLLEPQLIGRPNYSNLLATAAVTLDLGYPLEVVRQGLNRCPPVPGRFEVVSCGQPFQVVVDYAHTPDALEKVLQTGRNLHPRRLLLLFGCGGDRDRTKRPLMGRVAEDGSDFVVITSDNPRGEDPRSIIAEIEQGLKGSPAHYLIEPDRRGAIHSLLRMAQPGDLVILAGKGHETYQILAGGTIHFDDREEARWALEELGYGG
jgi:UDP-N-acetylmuramoyl-L-alanyl-D-glutamate--2,6-diaminopimelate ligase